MTGPRPWGAIVLASAAVTGGGAAAEPLSLEYRTYLLGVPIASASAQIEMVDDRYRVRGWFETGGVVSLFSPWTQEAISSGRLDGAGPTSAERHWQSGTYKGEARHIDLRYAPERATITSAAPDPDGRRPERRVPPDLTAGTTDPLSGLLAVARQVGEGGGCAAVLPVFDGRHRYDVTFRDGGTGSGPGADGAIECRFVVTQLAGFSKDRGLATDPDRPGRIWFRQVAPEMPAIPVRLELATSWGSAVVELVGIAQGANETAVPVEG